MEKRPVSASSSDFEKAFDIGADALADSIAGAGPGLASLLRDPVIRAVMAADGVATDALTSLLRQVAVQLGQRRPRRAPLKARRSISGFA